MSMVLSSRKILVACIALIVSASLSSCKITRVIEQVPVEVHDTSREVHFDTVRQNDTTIIERNTIVQMADSATLAKLKDMGLQLDKNKDYILVLQKELEQRISELSTIKSDSTYKHNETPVPLRQTEIIEVEKPLTWLQKIFIGFGIDCLIVIIIIVVIRFIKR